MAAHYKDIRQKYALEFEYHSLGYALYTPVAAAELEPPCAGFFNDNGDFNLIARLTTKSSPEGLSGLAYEPRRRTKIDISWQPKTSLGVESTLMDTSIETPNNLPGGADAHIKYSSKRNFGAILMTTNPITLHAYNDERLFMTWLEENRDLLYEKHGKQLRAHGMWIVTRTHSAPNASIRAWTGSSSEAIVSVKAKASMLGELGENLNWKDELYDNDWSHYNATTPGGVVVFIDGIWTSKWFWRMTPLRNLMPHRSAAHARAISSIPSYGHVDTELVAPLGQSSMDDYVIETGRPMRSRTSSHTPSALEQHVTEMERLSQTDIGRARSQSQKRDSLAPDYKPPQLGANGYTPRASSENSRGRIPSIQLQRHPPTPPSTSSLAANKDQTQTERSLSPSRRQSAKPDTEAPQGPDSGQASDVGWAQNQSMMQDPVLAQVARDDIGMGILKQQQEDLQSILQASAFPDAEIDGGGAFALSRPASNNKTQWRPPPTSQPQPRRQSVLDSLSSEQVPSVARRRPLVSDPYANDPPSPPLSSSLKQEEVPFRARRMSNVEGLLPAGRRSVSHSRSRSSKVVSLYLDSKENILDIENISLRSTPSPSSRPRKSSEIRSESHNTPQALPHSVTRYISRSPPDPKQVMHPAQLARLQSPPLRRETRSISSTLSGYDSRSDLDDADQKEVYW